MVTMNSFTQKSDEIDQTVSGIESIFASKDKVDLGQSSILVEGDHLSLEDVFVEDPVASPSQAHNDSEGSGEDSKSQSNSYIVDGPITPAVDITPKIDLRAGWSWRTLVSLSKESESPANRMKYAQGKWVIRSDDEVEEVVNEYGDILDKSKKPGHVLALSDSDDDDDLFLGGARGISAREAQAAAKREEAQMQHLASNQQKIRRSRNISFQQVKRKSLSLSGFLSRLDVQVAQTKRRLQETHSRKTVAGPRLGRGTGPVAQAQGSQSQIEFDVSEDEGEEEEEEGRAPVEENDAATEETLSGADGDEAEDTGSLRLHAAYSGPLPSPSLDTQQLVASEEAAAGEGAASFFGGRQAEDGAARSSAAAPAAASGGEGEDRGAAAAAQPPPDHLTLALSPSLSLVGLPSPAEGSGGFSLAMPEATLTLQEYCPSGQVRGAAAVAQTAEEAEEPEQAVAGSADSAQDAAAGDSAGMRTYGGGQKRGKRLGGRRRLRKAEPSTSGCGDQKDTVSKAGDGEMDSPVPGGAVVKTRTELELEALEKEEEEEEEEEEEQGTVSPGSGDAFRVQESEPEDFAADRTPAPAPARSAFVSYIAEEDSEDEAGFGGGRKRSSRPKMEMAADSASEDEGRELERIEREERAEQQRERAFASQESIDPKREMELCRQKFLQDSMSPEAAAPQSVIEAAKETEKARETSAAEVETDKDADHSDTFFSLARIKRSNLFDAVRKNYQQARGNTPTIVASSSAAAPVDVPEKESPSKESEKEIQSELFRLKREAAKRKILEKEVGDDELSLSRTLSEFSQSLPLSSAGEAENPEMEANAVTAAPEGHHEDVLMRQHLYIDRTASFMKHAISSNSIRHVEGILPESKSRQAVQSSRAKKMGVAIFREKASSQGFGDTSQTGGAQGGVRTASGPITFDVGRIGEDAMKAKPARKRARSVNSKMISKFLRTDGFRRAQRENTAN